ncbi:hypothetical protein [Actinophytocola algeriensis]|uniref:Signal transduction histidine kinase n=1 Tax=Actinophytocola algeriensis TaxID=1768010 RepID=A0A7W7Q1J5_9PSEU|nr:hypothetical protein [Actinophytocola algeriensis]MBB4905104.1 hypothetical protein [Actinophytocola algeriensis]MBE1473211.1 hypothetical protein [Actinophytocola algeriensis]
MTDLAPGRPASVIERRLVAMTTVVLLAVALTVQVGLNGHVLVVPEAGSRTELIVYGVLAVLGGVCAVALFVRGRIPGPLRWAGVAVLLCCSLVMSGLLPPHPMPVPNHWSIGLIGWYGLVLLYDLAIGWVVAFLLAHVATLGVSMAANGATAVYVADMGVTFVSVAGFQLGVALSARLLRRIADDAFRTSRAAEELRVREEEAAAEARNHERRYADLSTTTIPLLAGLADGVLDPGAEAVRRRCAVEAARMRRLLIEGDGVADPLVHELGAIIDVAERHGASVQLSVSGTPGELPEDVRRELLAPISEALVTTRSPARVTVLHGPDQVRVSARCAAPELPITQPGMGGVSLVEFVTDGQVWLETAWRSR